MLMICLCIFKDTLIVNVSINLFSDNIELMIKWPINVTTKLFYCGMIISKQRLVFIINYDTNKQLLLQYMA